jgi:hypothetical protein
MIIRFKKTSQKICNDFRAMDHANGHRRAEKIWSCAIHDQPVRFLKGKLRLRQVTRLCDGRPPTILVELLNSKGAKI